MSWFKGLKENMKAAAAQAAAVVAPLPSSTPSDELRNHITYLREFAEATKQERAADWDKLAMTYRIPEEVDQIMQLLEAECPSADEPSQGPCTMHFLEQNCMELFYELLGLENSVSVQKTIIKAVIRALRLRYELLDNGSIARLVMQMAELLEYCPRRISFAIVHCEFLYTLCDKVHRNPSALLPVVISENVNSGALGREFLLLNWSIQHLQDAAGGEYAQRGVLSLLQIPDGRVTDAVVNHSALIERTVRMVDSGFQAAMHSIESGEGGMDEVGSRRQRPDSAGFYAAMRFVDHIVKVADLRVSHQLLQLLDSVFLRKTLQQRLIKGSEVEHVGIMEMIRGLFEPDLVWQQQGRNHRRLQQPQLISMLARMLVGLPSLTEGMLQGKAETARLMRQASDAGGAGRGVGVLETLICRIDSMSESESCEALQLLLALVDLHDDAVMQQLVFSGLRRPPIAAALAACHPLEHVNEPQPGPGGEGGDGGAEDGSVEGSSQRFLLLLDGLLAGVPVDEGVAGGAAGTAGGEEKLEQWRDEYRKDAILHVSLCFRCSDLWEHGPGRAQHAASASSSTALAPEAPAAAAEGDAGAGAETGVDLLDSVLAKLTNLLSNSWSTNVCLIGMVVRLMAYPDRGLHYLLTSQTVGQRAGSVVTLPQVLLHINDEICGRSKGVDKCAERLARFRAQAQRAPPSTLDLNSSDIEEQREREVIRGAVLLHEFRTQLRYTLETKVLCCHAWRLDLPVRGPGEVPS